MTPTTLALQVPLKSRGETDPSLERSRQLRLTHFACTRSCGAPVPSGFAKRDCGLMASTIVSLAMLLLVGCTANHLVRRNALFAIGRAAVDFAAREGLDGPLVIEPRFFLVNSDTDFMSGEMDRDIPDPTDLVRGLSRRQAHSPPGILLRGAREAAKNGRLGMTKNPALAKGRICFGQTFLAKDLSGALVVVGQGRNECGSSMVMYLVPSGSAWVVEGLGDFTVY